MKNFKSAQVVHDVARRRISTTYDEEVDNIRRQIDIAAEAGDFECTVKLMNARIEDVIAYELIQSKYEVTKLDGEATLLISW